MNVVLISTYELGHQPFGLASPAAWLQGEGATVDCIDLAVQRITEPAAQRAIAAADLIAFYLPMHTATRLAASVIPQVRAWQPAAHLCCYGLYAPVNEAFLRSLGVHTILGGEFEQGLASLYQRIAANSTDRSDQIEPRISLAKQHFRVPDRARLPTLDAYAFVDLGNGSRRTAGYTEATRGCKHQCRHCPIVPVYQGQFRVIQREVVLADVAQQIAAGAQHITFGDPDFFNGPGHAIPIVRALHQTFPHVTYDVTIKIEHLLKHRDLLPVLRDTGCLFVTSAVEAVDDQILAIFDKRHTRADFVRAVAVLRDVGLTLNPTFVAWTPWTTRAGYRNWLATIAELDLIDQVAPIQYAIRLLIPAGSKLLELPDVRDLVQPFDQAGLCYPWAHPDPHMDQMFEEIWQLVQARQKTASRRAIFAEVWQRAWAANDGQQTRLHMRSIMPRTPVPQLSEPWYC